ncbi:serine/threonine-protein kinase [Polyangium sp. 15x6]|uniref:serine/threonine-protein kinase n=1 Tax=Polyangium sp. 15x6 TaxID=3042687 RepID=UPI002499FEB3|nr:serine/threonine-protein kinase [Polyangium sp. 15x6]MDI3284684.1 serine/threonine-protein kinase [Polyangium sp. 15x6]
MSTESASKSPVGVSAEPKVPALGDVVAGKYRVERVIGKGGMGLVVEAQHTTLPQRVAIKILLPEAAKQGDAVERFLREARAVVSIQSEHVARVMDLGTLESGLPYMVMELLTGADLQEIVRQRGPLPVAQAIDAVLQASEAIAEAHVLGIIHRDLKPANIFVATRPDGSPLVKVLDFGLAKAARADALYTSLTAANVIIGSPFYMSPEQIRGLKGLDARTDIWALGVILYQILTGKRPFEAEATHALFLMIGGDPPAPPRWHRSEIPAGLEAVVLQCLEKKPNDRPQSVADLARLLLPFASEEGRISVERIHRLQGVAPPPRPPSIVEGTEKGAALEQAAWQAFGEVSMSDNATTLRQPAKAPPPEVPAAPPAPAHALAAPAALAEEPNARNGATVVIPKPAPMPPAPIVEAPKSSSRGLVGVVVAVVALVVIAAVLALRAW